jgi:ribose/xylose/arabinose/galactoside ABC-type transport system permease subunit
MTLVIISGAIDLSVGSLVALVTVVIAAILQMGADPWIALFGGIAAAVIAGGLNGFIITRLNVGSFIVTLGSLLIFRGLAKGVAHDQKIDAPASWLSSLLATLPKSAKWQIFPLGVWVLLVGALLTGWLLHSTRFGRHLVAVGSNEVAARYSAISVAGVRLKVYLVMGFFAGLAGLMQFSRLTVGDPTVANGLELDVIAAVVIGGASLSGGTGTILGSMIGAFIMSIIRAGGSQMGWPNWVQEIVTGSIIILAVALDRWRARTRT